jgi:hypothetical protein
LACGVAPAEERPSCGAEAGEAMRRTHPHRIGNGEGSTNWSGKESQMRRFLSGTLIASAVAAGIVTAPAPAAAQLYGARLAAPLHQTQPLATEVQYRRHGWRGHRHSYDRRRHHDWGPALGAAIIGGIALGALAAQPRYYPYYAPDDAVAYCMRRFRSYDPVSGTYLGYDGLRHPCP